MARTNAERRRDAQETLMHHTLKLGGDAAEEMKYDPHSCLVDLLTDLMHWAPRCKVDFNRALQYAQGNYGTEKRCFRCRSTRHDAENCTSYRTDSKGNVVFVDE